MEGLTSMGLPFFSSFFFYNLFELAVKSMFLPLGREPERLTVINADSLCLALMLLCCCSLLRLYDSFHANVQGLYYDLLIGEL